MDSDAFRRTLTAYDEARARKEELAAAAREVGKRARELQASVLEYMQEHDINECVLDSGARLVRKEQRKTEGLKKEHIEGELKKLLGGDANSVESAVTNMYNRRVTDITETLVVVKAKQA